MRFLLFPVLVVLLSACASSLDVGRQIDARRLAVALEEGLNNRSDALMALGWPDSCLAVDSSRWRYGDATEGLPSGTASVWSYYQLRVTNRCDLSSGPFQPSSQLLRLYFSGDGTLLGWDLQGTGASLPPTSLKTRVEQRLAALPHI
ncbi:MAG: hypothetical protein D6751_01785 [Deltaproteobacteria bacterium]|nr:MAG: hypothetical protein D6751_01785 [Deltaproteobacteria bacterium]